MTKNYFNIFVKGKKIWRRVTSIKKTFSSKENYIFSYFPIHTLLNCTVEGVKRGLRYRYGFNGMEKDDNVKGRGNSYTTEFRQYDPRVGRWLSIDPLFAHFPWQSPYVAFDNNPIFYKDPKGLAAEGGGDEEGPVKKGDVFTGADGKEYTTTAGDTDIKSPESTFLQKLKRAFNKRKRGIQNTLNKIGETLQRIDDFLSKRKREYSPYEDRNKNPYETLGGIHGTSEDGQGAENHKVLYVPKEENEPKTVNYDELIPGLIGFKNAKANRKWFDRVKKIQTSTNVADKAREAASNVGQPSNSDSIFFSRELTNGQIEYWAVPTDSVKGTHPWITDGGATKK